MNKNSNLLKITPSNFEENYKIITKNEFIMGAENPIIKLQTESEIFFKQEITKNSIINYIKTKTLKGETDNVNMKTSLNQMLNLADISSNLIIERTANGKIKKLLNLDELEKDWQKWKEIKLNIAFPEIKKQIAFVENYENGLTKMIDGIKRSFQYQLIMPTFYNLNTNNYKTTETQLISKLIAEMKINYHLNLQKSENSIGNLTTSYNFTSEVTNKEYIKENFVIPLYKKNNAYTISDYKFKILTDYLIENETNKILKANFYLIEQIHENLTYKIEINLTTI